MWLSMLAGLIVKALVNCMGRLVVYLRASVWTFGWFVTMVLYAAVMLFLIGAAVLRLAMMTDMARLRIL